MSDKMKVRDGNDGYSYPYTSPDLVVDKNGKSNTSKFNEIDAQFKDIANYSLEKKSDDGKLYLKKGNEYVGSGIEFPTDVDLSKVTMSINGQTLKLLNDGVQIATVEIPTAVVTDEQLTSIIQSKIDDGTLSALTIQKGSITVDKLSDEVQNNLIEVTKTEENNLIDLADFIKQGTGLYPTNGNEYPSAGMMITDFIPIKNNTKYGNYGVSRIGVYDENKKFIEYMNNIVYTTSDKAKYIKIEALKTSTKIYFGENVKTSNLLRMYSDMKMPSKTETVTISRIPTYKDIYSNIFEIDSKDINLITNIVKGKLPPNGYAISPSDERQIIDFVELQKDKTYTIKSPKPITSIFFYDEEYTLLVTKDININSEIPFTFTLNNSYLGKKPMSNIIYFRANLDIGGLDSKYGGTMLVEGAEIGEYEPIGSLAKTKMKNISTILNQILAMKNFFKLQGKNWVAHGDSITYYSEDYAQYVKYANNYLYCNLTNLGHAGATMALRNSENVSSVTNADDKLSMAYLSTVTDYSKYDVCTIFFGTNDMSSNVPIGTVDSEDEKTYLGALNKSIQRMYASNHKLKILLITPIYRIEETNLGLDAYRTALNNFGKKHGIPVVNMHELCNINAFNKNGTLIDGLHPTGTGAEHIGAVLAGEMLRYF